MGFMKALGLKKGKDKKNGSGNRESEQAVASKKGNGFFSKKEKRTFDNEYERGKKIGAGAFANVFIGIQKTTRQEFAVKNIVDRSTMQFPGGRDMLVDEVACLKLLRKCSSVVYLEDFFEEGPQCFLVMEVLRGGELFEQIISKKFFTEEEAKDVCRCVLSALDHMHDKRIAHRDLKPENLMLANDDLRSVKLCDFGFARTVQTKNGYRTRCGTPGFMAPEVLERWPSYDVKCDVWSFGVIMFFMLGGENPFDPPGCTENQCYEFTARGNFYFRPDQWRDLSFESKDLVACCLRVNPSSRISSKTALAHDWLGSAIKSKRSTRISTVALQSAVLDLKANKHEAPKGDKKGRVDKLNAEFEKYLKDRKGDSLVSMLSGGDTISRSGPSIGLPPRSRMRKEDSESGRPFGDFYTVGQQLGTGSFAKVSRCTHKETQLVFAVKEIDVRKMNDRVKRMLAEEINVLKFLRGAPHVIRLYDVFEELNTTYLIMEEMKGGDLLDRIREKTAYTERNARDLGKYLFEAVKYCHGKKIAHRDIKLENLLMVEKNNDASVKLADFGFAKRTKIGGGLKTFCGTPKYMAPEIFGSKASGKEYDNLCDMWSVGVVMYVLIAGCMPFTDKAVEDIGPKVMNGEYEFKDEDWEARTPACKTMVSQLMEVDPRKRLSADKALECEWMGLDAASLAVCDLGVAQQRISVLRDSVRKEKEEKRAHSLKAAATAVMGMQRLTALAAGAKLDVSSGTSSDADVPFEKRYELGEEVMDTLYGQIHEAIDKVTGVQYSIKKVIRRVLHPHDAKAVNDEIAVLRAASECKNVVDLHEVYEDADITAIVLEHINGQPLINQLIERKSIHESDAKDLARNLLGAVDFFHKKRIANRNLTLENLILMNGTQSDIRIYDLEFAKKVPFPNSLVTQCGVQEYVAPEVLARSPAYDVPCDMWSVGVIIFLLLGGYYPFRGGTEEKTLYNSRYGIFSFKKKYWKNISEDAKSLIRKMLTVDPEERVTAEQALSSSWMSAGGSVLSADLIENMKELRISVNPDKVKEDMEKAMKTMALPRASSPKIRVSDDWKEEAWVPSYEFGR